MLLDTPICDFGWVSLTLHLLMQMVRAICWQV